MAIVGIHIYLKILCRLHQGAYTCAMDLAYGRGVDKYLIYWVFNIFTDWLPIAVRNCSIFWVWGSNQSLYLMDADLIWNLKLRIKEESKLTVSQLAI